MNFYKNKYHAKKTVIDGIKFDSQKEANRYLELKLLQAAGQIADLELQKHFLIIPKINGNKRARFYVADFVYTENGKAIIEDVKSPITKKNPVYSLKKAAVLAFYPQYEFRET